MTAPDARPPVPAHVFAVLDALELLGSGGTGAGSPASEVAPLVGSSLDEALAALRDAERLCLAVNLEARRGAPPRWSTLGGRLVPDPQTPPAQYLRHDSAEAHPGISRIAHLPPDTYYPAAATRWASESPLPAPPGMSPLGR